MWVQIAQRGRRLEAAGTNLAKNARNAVVVASVLFAAAIFALVSRGLMSLVNLLCVAAQLIIMLLYIVASRKLLSAIGTTSDTAKGIATLTKRLAIGLGVMLLVNLSYPLVEILVKPTNIIPTYMFLAVQQVALSPVSFLIIILLLMRYIHHSFKRHGRGGSSRSATVSPAPGDKKQTSSSAHSTKEAGAVSGTGAWPATN